MDVWSDFQGVNAGYVAELYERYSHDPNSVDPQTRAFFAQSSPPEFGRAFEPRKSVTSATPSMAKIVAAVNLAESIRKFGNLAADLDPLGTPLPGDPSLDPKTYGITESDLKELPANIIASPVATGAANALEVIRALRRIYASHSGYDYAHLREPVEREWLLNATESGSFRPPNNPVNELAILERLTQEGAFEVFLHRTFPGKTRFSIEGLGILIPVLDEIIQGAAEAAIQQVLIGMGHRGRLNVLAHVLNKPYAQLLAEFKDPVKASKFRGDLGWTGDVKYHSGAHLASNSDKTHNFTISLAPNPSHLEAVNPVVMGMARAGGTRTGQPGPPQFDPMRTLPILIHGDASFPAQGVVAETLNLLKLPGFGVGGALHVIANNQIGFTTPPDEGRSTIFASDLARGFRIPIVHVNADDPEACIEAARLAFAYRVRFHKDFLIDLVGYRRYGHNEGDEPSFTQPVMYQKIANHPTVRQLWVKTLLQRGIIKDGFADELVRKRLEYIQGVFNSLVPETQLVQPVPELAQPGTARRAKTAVSLERLVALNQALRHLPDGFSPNRKIERALERKRSAFEDVDAPSIDWSSAEDLAWASVLGKRPGC